MVDENELPRTVGAILRGWRQQRNVSIEEISARTRIRSDLLRQLENDSFESLPAAVYVTGYIRGYARALNFDPDPALQAYQTQTRLPGVEYMPDTNTPIGYDRRPTLRSVGMLVGTLIGIVIAVNIFVSNYEPAAAVEPGSTPAAAAPIETHTLSLIPPFQTRDPDPVLNIDDLRFRLIAEMNVSVQIFVDGDPLYTGFMKPGESFEWFAADGVRLIVDNAGGVRVEIDGTDVGSLGGIGERVERDWQKPDRSQ
jgi:transcriptional regulator with XRE-family HTH domain